ncbi:MAG: ABC transporter permease [Thermoanaerobaculum sp.]
MRVHFRIAEAQLRLRPRRALLALTSVSVGTGMLIVTLSLTEGLSEDFVEKTIQTSAHIEVLPRRLAEFQAEALKAPNEVLALSRHRVPDEKQTVRPLAKILALCRQLPGVLVATPAVEAQAVLVYGTSRRPVLLSGIIPKEEASVTNIAQRVIAGRWEDLEQNRDGVVLGWQVAKNLGVQVGSPVQAQGPQGTVSALRVVAIVQTGLASVDKFLALVNVDRAQAITGLAPDQVTKVRLRLADPWAAGAVAPVAQELLGYQCVSWQERARAQIDSFDRQNLITRVLVVFTMLVAGFGVANVLVQIVSEKRRDIAILRAVGFTARDILVIHLIQGTLLGLLGAAVGWGLGALLIRIVARIPIDFGEAALLQNEYLRMSEQTWFYLLALILALVVCTIGAIQPARSAARLLPTAILRGER